jgi:hypothetical protein
MTREPARQIPKGIVKARQLINELAAESELAITASNPYWTETQIISNPFITNLSYDRENIEIQIDITVGRIFDTSAANELNSMLPIPINIQFSLDPQPILFVSESLAVTPETTKIEIRNFLNTSFIKSLMVVQTLLVTDGFVTEEKIRWENFSIPKAQSLWDFGSLTLQILSSHGK